MTIHAQIGMIPPFPWDGWLLGCSGYAARSLLCVPEAVPGLVCRRALSLRRPQTARASTTTATMATTTQYVAL